MDKTIELSIEIKELEEKISPFIIIAVPDPPFSAIRDHNPATSGLPVVFQIKTMPRP